MPDSGPDERPFPQIVRTTAWIATVGVLVALLGLASLFRTVHSPVQDCGTAIGFLLEGRVDVYADPDHPPKGLTRAEVEASNARPCRPRVAAKAKPGLIVFASGMLAAVIAALVEVVIRVRGYWKRRAAPA